MHVHLVFCHPSEDSLTAKVRDSFLQGLKDAGHSYTISDLYKMNFQTDMTEEEYLRDGYYQLEPSVAKDVQAEQFLINTADTLVFIYPVFWTEAPAKLVGWFDRVWSYGFAYGQEQASKLGLATMKQLKQALFLAIAGDTEEALEEQGRLQAMRTVMLEDRIFDRAAKKELVLLGGSERSNPKLRTQMEKKHLKTAYGLALSLDPNKAD